MSYPKKRICPKGHDTKITGRNSAYRCRLCSCADSNKWHRSKSKEYWYEYHRQQNLKKLYGLTTGQYNWFFDNQNGKCLGCSRHQEVLSRRLNVDHDHKTGKIRGLLCDGCNRALGFVEEKVQTLMNLASYLKENNNGNDTKC